eukprot:gb/GFBE01006987.1/.p1 GENE.gb/GFBE01006987.1/~~gb/GFBE01006987.1/.p1  ORF type:complete len:199 (+),score=53.97 gb/GFBE01006987.1/:1-597(+)
MKRGPCEEDGRGDEKRCPAASMPTPQSLSVREFEEHVRSCQLKKFGFDYYMHGLVEEAGEAFEAVRASRGKAPESCSQVANEIGDVLWYATSFSMELGSSVQMPSEWPQGRAGTHEAEVRLLAAVAKLAGRVKKSLRGDKALDEFLPAMRQYRDEVLQLCADVAVAEGLTLQRCAVANVIKLKGRFDRGSVQGDGDDR